MLKLVFYYLDTNIYVNKQYYTPVIPGNIVGEFEETIIGDRYSKNRIVHKKILWGRIK